MNREILDHFLAAAIVLLTLIAADRPNVRVTALLGRTWDSEFSAMSAWLHCRRVVGFLLWRQGSGGELQASCSSARRNGADDHAVDRPQPGRSAATP